jgi:hypothetical protein
MGRARSPSIWRTLTESGFRTDLRPHQPAPCCVVGHFPDEIPVDCALGGAESFFPHQLHFVAVRNRCDILSYRRRRLRLIASRLRAERDREAVPAIDPDDREREVDERLLIEMTSSLDV